MSFETLNSIRNNLHAIKVVSFDVFDTTIHRKCGKPENIFSLIGENFEKRRIRAEVVARTFAKLRRKKEVNLKEIYRFLPNDDLKIEMEVEYRNSIRNEVLCDFINKELSQDIKLFFVSDMYLDREFIEELLLKAGIDREYELLVSNDLGVTKTSGLYEVLIKLAGVSHTEILHVGDNENSDYHAPKKSGIHAILWR